MENKLENVNIDIIINCAGIFGPSLPSKKLKTFLWKNLAMTENNGELSFNNKNITDNIKNSKPQIILNLSSDAGSISLNKSGDAHIYRTSKSALNSITKNMSS